MSVDLILAILGLVILLMAGDALVRGAVNTSLRLGVPALIVSLTIVAFGTSAPELLISISAILDGVPGLAMGNVVGSNTANILLVLGLPALLAGLDTGTCETRRNYMFMLAASLLFIGLAMGGVIAWPQGLVLLGGLGMMLVSAFHEARTHRRRGRAAEAAEAAEAEQADGVPEEDLIEELEGADPDMPWWKILLFLVLGLVGLPLGANLLVEASTSIARHMGISETVIGLTLVALGTSLPELATTVMAAYRRQAEVALGNVIGSNMFNLLAIIGISSLFGPIPVEPGILYFDIWVMFAASLMLAPFVLFRWHMGRLWGAAFCLLYAGYIFMLLGGG